MQQAHGLCQVHGAAAPAGHQGRAVLAAEQGQGVFHMSAGGFAAGFGMEGKGHVRLAQRLQHGFHRARTQQNRSGDQQNFAGNPVFDQGADACGLAFAEGDQTG